MTDLLWDLIAIVVLTGPAEPRIETDVAWPAPLRHAVARQCERLEVTLCPHAVAAHDYGFSVAVSEARFDLDTLRDAPPVRDRWRFPPSEISDANQHFARAYMDHLRAERALRPHVFWWFDAALEEAEWHRLCHYEASWATWPCGPSIRRRHLAELRRLLGDAAYAAGRLPPSVPIKRFQHIR